MKKMLLIPVLVLLVAPTFGQEFFSYAFGKKYRFEITAEQLAKSPSWDEQSDNPPLAAGKAIRLASVLRNRLVKDSKDFTWRLMSAKLERDVNPPDSRKWWWSINYEAWPREGMSEGILDHLKIIVLMDGTVIEPKVSDW